MESALRCRLRVPRRIPPRAEALGAEASVSEGKDDINYMPELNPAPFGLLNSLCKSSIFRYFNKQMHFVNLKGLG